MRNEETIINKQEIYNNFKATFGDSKYDYLKAIETNGKTTMRVMFGDYLDYLQKDGQITERQRMNTLAPKELY